MQVPRRGRQRPGFSVSLKHGPDHILVAASTCLGSVSRSAGQPASSTEKHIRTFQGNNSISIPRRSLPICFCFCFKHGRANPKIRKSANRTYRKTKAEESMASNDTRRKKTGSDVKDKAKAHHFERQDSHVYVNTPSIFVFASGDFSRKALGDPRKALSLQGGESRLVPGPTCAASRGGTANQIQSLGAVFPCRLVLAQEIVTVLGMCRGSLHPR